MEITELIKSKRSIKKYQNKPVEHSLIEQIVEAGITHQVVEMDKMSKC